MESAARAFNLDFHQNNHAEILTANKKVTALRLAELQVSKASFLSTLYSLLSLSAVSLYSLSLSVVSLCTLCLVSLSTLSSFPLT